MTDAIVPGKVKRRKKTPKSKSAQSDPLLNTINLACAKLLEKQVEEGYWLFELEADTTIPSEYILLHEYLGTRDADREARIRRYLLRRQ